ncbi:UvrD-helicase domain-containing protein [Dyadobacter chenwenxiniae]|uniref:DNA 3'-5' helicase n=1 Tax=Dyadobacter chenwenxiniae TaxID=2906456 RepID=A0A9X1PMZ5_9BACT|nr:UvrD-helicase domain-containing protein [Dyadobacter chenwenxiniae]MCF0062969.1 UvrD-helicase domain-containing protein [Dyadobacter chenwenxiniae]UON84857.1 UvrD-helicase domain-containing protein [Dyadobacter chenwenxiniae]
MFKVYSSSAGSGKTYTLTKEYLKLALHSNSDTYFRHILAVTFTNAAANEMKDRILLMLRVFSDSFNSDAVPPPMLRDVVTEMYPDTLQDNTLFEGACQLIAGRAQLVFRQILHRYSDFSVMTIDKFTQRLISSFTDELGIPFIFETQLDSDLLDDAVDRLLARIGQDGEEVLTEIVEKYYLESAEEGKSWGSLPMQIRGTAGTLLSEQSYMQMKRVEDLKMQDWIAIRKQMRTFVREREAYVTKLSKQALELIQSTFLTEKDFHQGGRGIYGYFRDRAEEKKRWAEPNSYVYKTIGEGVWYGAKAPVLIKDEIEKVRTDLENYFHQIENVRSSESQKITLYGLLDRHIYNLSLLGEIRKEFDALLKQNNQVHISDFNRKIVEIVAREPVPFIFERLGERYNHILVDEFQDTSKLQFANLLPLIENALSGGFFNLIVGDAKQSIYRFRGGDMDLILHLATSQVMALANVLGNNSYNAERLLSIDNYLDVNHLKVNRRSRREITDFNNKFFAFVAETVGAENMLIQDVYDQNFQQEIPESVPSGGHVEIEFLEMHEDSDDTDEGNPADSIVKRSLELVTELRAQGYDWRDMAILCRKKKEATALASTLKEAGLPLISDDALSLGYSRSVHFIISFMKVLLSADHRLARYEAAYLFHHVIRRENPAAGEYEQIRILCEESGLDTFLEYFKKWNINLSSFRMRQLSVFELSEQLMQRFGLFENHFENEYLFRFLDVVLDFGNRKSNHLGDFLTYWESARHKLSITIPDETDAIRITTIHKSKGLEYPVVIVPYAHWKVTPNAKLDRLWIDLDEVDYEELTLAGEPGYAPKKLRSSMVSVVKDLENTAITTQYTDERTRTLVENLNLLYVAFTRPVQRLYILAKRERRWESGQQVSNWLQNYLAQQDFEPAWNESESKYIIADGHSALMHAHRKSDAQPFVLNHILSNDRTESLRLRRMADRIFDVETFEPKHDRLQKIRYLLTRLKTISDLPLALDRLVGEGIFTKSETAEIEAQTIDLLNDPDLLSLYQDVSKVQTNKELLIPGGTLLHIDRVVEQADGEFIFMSFVGGSNADEPRRHLRKLIKTYEGAGRRCRGVLITLENELVEWISVKGNE